jgi:cell wall-associated NlpC family hydrolase
VLGARRIVSDSVVACLAAVFTLLIAFVAVAAGPAQADPAAVRQAAGEAAALRDQVQQLNDQVEIAVEDYNKVADSLAKTDQAMQENHARLAATQRDLGVAKARLSARVDGMYRRGNLATIELFVGAGSLSDLINRLEALVRIGSADSRIVRDVEAYRTQVADHERRLETDHHSQQKLAAQADKARAEVETKQADRSRALSGKEAELARLEAEEAARLDMLKRAAEETVRLAEVRGKANAAAGRTSVATTTIVGSNRGVGAVQIAARYLSVPYLWGGATPAGFDCSGLVQYVFAQLGVFLPRVSRDQKTVGVPVERDQLQPGDLVFYGNPVHHVGIYAGSGTMINAPFTGSVVRFDSVDRRHYSGARRVV